MGGREHTPKGVRSGNYGNGGREHVSSQCALRHTGAQSHTGPSDRGAIAGGYPRVMSETHLSREAYERLQAELEDLTTRGRVDIAQAIETARELGDLKENADYHAAREDQGRMEARIRQLQSLVDNAIIVEGTEASDTVNPGSIVALRYEGDDDADRYLVGSIEERRDDVAVVSPASPLGQALLGRRKGDTVEYEAPRGNLKVEILDIEA
jgi:transcription elongation factor GreA